MRRRGGDAEPARQTEPPKKRTRTLSETLNLQTGIKIDKPLPYGEILTDVTQKEWKIGKPIGCGSFGEIYLASDDVSEEVTAQNSRYVIKIEPHSNGPLFVEIHCLIRSARHSKINKWKKEKKLGSIGMPHYIANGSHLLEDTRYRFLVLPRYDCDVEKILASENTRQMSAKNVLTIATQIIDVLEYIHAHGYTHSDIKSSNLMIGFDGTAFKDKTLPAPESLEIGTKKSFVKSPKQNTKFSSYYYDEDFVLHNYLSSTSNTDYETDDEKSYERKSRTTKFSKPGKIVKMKKTTNQMKRLFNLRKIKSDVNYEDLNSSICSYDSYQELLESHINKDKNAYVEADENIDNDVDHFHEAIESQSQGQVYLLDFGLASKFLNSDSSHKEFVMDARKAHDGTLEYSSRDSHIGAHSRRSDLEILGYNLIDWMTGNLPWKTSETLADPELVFALKKSYMEDLQRFMETSFKSANYPKFIEKYFSYVNKLSFDEKPDYRFCKNLFIDEFIASGYGSQKDMTLNFAASSPIKKKVNYSKKFGRNPSKNTPPDFLKRNAIVKVYGRENSQINSWKSDLTMDLIREGLSNDGIRKPCISRNFYVSDADLISKLRQTLLLNHDTPSKKFSPKNLRSTKKPVKKKKGKNATSGIGKFGNFLGSNKQYTWAEILAGDPERICRRNDKEKNPDIEYSKNPRSRKASNASEISVANIEINPPANILHAPYITSLNPTYAIKEVVANFKRKSSGKATKIDILDVTFNGQRCTPSMIKVMNAIEKMNKKEKQSEIPMASSKKRKLTAKNLSIVHEEENVHKTRAPRKVAPKSISEVKPTKPKATSVQNTPRSRGRPKSIQCAESPPVTKAIKRKAGDKPEPVRKLRRRTALELLTEDPPVELPAEKLSKRIVPHKSVQTAATNLKKQTPKRTKQNLKSKEPAPRVNTRSRGKMST